MQLQSVAVALRDKAEGVDTVETVVTAPSMNRAVSPPTFPCSVSVVHCQMGWVPEGVTPWQKRWYRESRGFITRAGEQLPADGYESPRATMGAAL